MTVPESIRYCAENAGLVIIHRLDMMTLIYHRRSGITHMVADPVPQILEVMGDETIHVAEIARRIVAAFDVDPGANIIALISERLDELAALGLVEACHAA